MWLKLAVDGTGESCFYSDWESSIFSTPLVAINRTFRSDSPTNPNVPDWERSVERSRSHPFRPWHMLATRVASIYGREDWVCSRNVRTSTDWTNVMRDVWDWAIQPVFGRVFVLLIVLKMRLWIESILRDNSLSQQRLDFRSEWSDWIVTQVYGVSSRWKHFYVQLIFDYRIERVHQRWYCLEKTKEEMKSSIFLWFPLHLLLLKCGITVNCFRAQ